MSIALEESVTESSNRDPADTLMQVQIIDPSAMYNFNALVTDWTEAATAKHGATEQTPVAINEGYGLHFNELSIYHGGCESGIQQFRESTDTTVGAGLYATSMVDQAFGYAVVRAHQSDYIRQKTNNGALEEPEKKPVAYELTLRDVSFADLRTPENVNHFLTEFTDYLQKWSLEKQLNNDPILKPDSARLIAERVAQLKDEDHDKHYSLARAVGGHYLVGVAFKDYLASLGYDGLVSLEGGESIGTDYRFAGEHDSWVVFDPSTTATVTNEVSFVSPVVEDAVAIEHNKVIFRKRSARIGSAVIPQPADDLLET
jgi:hypothetical protein